MCIIELQRPLTQAKLALYHSLLDTVTFRCPVASRNPQVSKDFPGTEKTDTYFNNVRTI